ncbi:MAG: NADP-dependent oxidoreductase [Solirubrobacterales bacterium]
MGVTTREIRLASRPEGAPTSDNFELAERELDEPGDGQVLIRNAWMSVDPYMRGRMNDVKSYVPPFEIGKALQGGAVGQVIESKADSVSEGDWVQNQLGWREYALADADGLLPVDPGLAPATTALGVLGMPGLTAWVGISEICQISEGDTLFMSAASGAVGSAGGQIAKLRGAKVIGSAGSAEKVDFLTSELGLDGAFNYKETPPAEALADLAPKGINAYFDNVGGDHLEAAIGALRAFGRIALCGMISQYNLTEPQPGPRNMPQLIGKRATMQGFIIMDHFDRMGDFADEVGPWVADGSLKYRETIVEGLEQAPQAFIDTLEGDKLGKMLVKVGPGPDEV